MRGIESPLFSVVLCALVVLVYWIFLEQKRIDQIRQNRERKYLEFEKKKQRAEERVIRSKIERVKATSRRYKIIQEINGRYVFNCKVKPYYECSTYVKSKSQFDHFDFERFLYSRIERQLQNFGNILSAVEENQRKYHWYQNELSALPAGVDSELSAQSNMTCQEYQRIESELCKELIGYPVVDVQLRCVVSYITPQGRKVYHNQKVFDYKYINKIYNEVLSGIKDKETAQYQRKRMTDSLRYDVMKRDHFRCTLCGRAANDNVKLHVDHIKPVSKGGKTEINNLRTLCSECNMGKRDKYDEYGIN